MTEPATYREPAKPPEEPEPRFFWCTLGVHDWTKEQREHKEYHYYYVYACRDCKREQEEILWEGAAMSRSSRMLHAIVVAFCLGVGAFGIRFCVARVEESQAEYAREAVEKRRASWQRKVAVCTQSCRALNASYVDLTAHGCFCQRGAERIALPNPEHE